MPSQQLDAFEIRPLSSADQSWVTQLIRHHWLSDFVVVHGAIFHPAELSGFAAFKGSPIGLVTYTVIHGECEIVSLNSLEPNLGIGTALVERVVTEARESGCHRVFLFTTNDNLHALDFYQKRGFVIFAVHRDGANQSRKIKPSIPWIGDNGIPIRDEIELEMIL